jgi:rhodanese-related sulfurtransferase
MMTTTTSGGLKVVSSSTFLLCLTLLFGFHAHNACCAIENLSSQTFYSIKDSVDAVVDVRSQSEWDSGHIEGAMLMEALSSFGEQGYQVATPMDLVGCEYCDIIVYCRSGSRSGAALTILQNGGFKGRLYNGQGVSDWTDASYPLVNTPSIAAPCTYNGTVSHQCYMDWLSRQTPTTKIVLEDKVYEAVVNSGSLMPSGFAGLFILGLTSALSMFM